MYGTLEMGFYCGLSILYPYSPTYCPTETCLGDCRGVMIFRSKSAPLPPTEALCVGYDPGTSQRFEWAARAVEAERRRYLGEKVCYWEDRK